MKRFRRATAMFLSVLVLFGSAVGIFAADESMQSQFAESVQTIEK